MENSVDDHWCNDLGAIPASSCQFWFRQGTQETLQREATAKWSIHNGLLCFAHTVPSAKETRLNHVHGKQFEDLPSRQRLHQPLKDASHKKKKEKQLAPAGQNDSGLHSCTDNVCLFGFQYKCFGLTSSSISRLQPNRLKKRPVFEKCSGVYFMNRHPCETTSKQTNFNHG